MKLCGTHGGSAKTDELLQLHMRNVLGSKLPSEMTNMEIKDALCYLVFLKQKQCGRMKGRGCLNGRSQRESMSKDGSSFPTAVSEALELSWTSQVHLRGQTWLVTYT